MKLATIEKVLSKCPIEGADKIEIITVLGWNVIAKKNEYNIGDYCIYIPIDTSVDPLREYFSFLKNEKKPTERVRINTKKLRGVYSQGLVIKPSCINLEQYTEGEDVSLLLDVQKYEHENIIIASGIQSNTIPFPKHLISMTDEDNLRTKYKCLSEYLDKEIYITLKMDGSSMTLISNKNEFFVCSRRLIVDESTVMHQYVTREKLNEKILALNKNIAIQGEFCGPKINGNQMGLIDYQFYVFNIKDLDTHKYYNLDEIITFCNELGIKMVPVLNKFICTDWTITKFQELANTVTYTLSANKKVPAEGIVIRPTKCVYSEILDKMLSTKIINQNYKN